MKCEDIVREIATELTASLPVYMKEQRWFRSKARGIKATSIEDIAPLEDGAASYYLALVRAEFEEGPHEIYYLPLAVAPSGGEDGSKLISTIKIGDCTVAVREATEDEVFNRLLLDAIEKSASVPSREGSFQFDRTDILATGAAEAMLAGSIKKISAEQSNTSVVFGDALIMKSFRVIEDGTNPDFDISHFLTTRTRFRNFPSLAGYIEYGKKSGEKATIAMLQDFIGGADDCWEWTCSRLKELYGSLRAQGLTATPPGKGAIRDVSGEYLKLIGELGRVTARLHLALASDGELPSFSPEPITEEDAGKWKDLFTCQISAVLESASRMLPSLPGEVREELSAVIEREPLLMKSVNNLSLLAEEGVAKIRVHGDYHLGQVLTRRGSFYILDFEGEPARPMAERKAKNCVLKDIAGMLRSFDYAAYAVLFEEPAEERDRLEGWGTAWRDLARRSFLDGYLEETGDGHAPFLPPSRRSLAAILSVYEMDKAVYELNYDMNHRPDWLKIPVRGLLGLSEDRTGRIPGADG